MVCYQSVWCDFQNLDDIQQVHDRQTHLVTDHISKGGKASVVQNTWIITLTTNAVTHTHNTEQISKQFPQSPNNIICSHLCCNYIHITCTIPGSKWAFNIWLLTQVKQSLYSNLNVYHMPKKSIFCIWYTFKFEPLKKNYFFKFIKNILLQSW